MHNEFLHIAAFGSIKKYGIFLDLSVVCLLPSNIFDSLSKRLIYCAAVGFGHDDVQFPYVLPHYLRIFFKGPFCSACLRFLGGNSPLDNK